MMYISNSKMIMQRTFHAVGQGAFYTEVFDDIHRSCYTMVYDCGKEIAKAKMDVPFNL